MSSGMDEGVIAKSARLKLHDSITSDLRYHNPGHLAACSVRQMRTDPLAGTAQGSRYQTIKLFRVVCVALYDSDIKTRLDSKP
jgi:hypothetical protein